MVASTLQAALRDFLDRRALAWPNGKADATRATSRSGYVAQMAKLRMVGGDFILAAAMAWRILAKAVGHINDAKCLELVDSNQSDLSSDNWSVSVLLTVSRPLPEE